MKSGFVRAKVVLFGQMVLFRQSNCVRVKCLYSGKSCCNRAKVVVFVQIGCLRAKLLSSGDVVVFGQSGCIGAKWLYSA